MQLQGHALEQTISRNHYSTTVQKEQKSLDKHNAVVISRQYVAVTSKM